MRLPKRLRKALCRETSLVENALERAAFEIFSVERNGYKPARVG
jgi:hypothetical protein